MYAKALISGLNRFIVEVEKLPNNTIFHMEGYYTCVIGKTLGWSSIINGQRERTALKTYFDIRRQKNEKYFSQNKSSEFKPEHWEVVRLFTTDIGMKVNKQQWLKLAKDQLAKMQKINSTQKGI